MRSREREPGREYGDRSRAKGGPTSGDLGSDPGLFGDRPRAKRGPTSGDLGSDPGLFGDRPRAKEGPISGKKGSDPGGFPDRNLIVKAADGLHLHVAVFDHASPKALVQLTHGACEFKELYFPLAQFLNDHGYAVAVPDIRGHGESINEQYPLGHLEGIGQLVSDCHRVSRMLKREYPGRELYLHGHSLGSLIARCYLQKHDDEISKLILTGTARYVPAVPAGMVIGKLCEKIDGKYGRSLPFRNISGAAAYRETAFEDNWVTSDREAYEMFAADERALFAWDNAGILTVFEGDRELKAYGKYRCGNPHLRIYSFTGGEDAFVGGEKGLADTVRTLRRIGYEHIFTKVYPENLHAVLFERNRGEVYEDILGCLEER